MSRVTPALLSLIMFLVVGALVALYIGKTLWATDEVVAPVEIRTIPMAIADIPAGTTVTEAHIGLGRVPADKLTPDMMLSNRVILGRVVKKPIKAGSAFRPDYLFAPGVRPPLDVADGHRAVTVMVDGTTGMVDSLVSPGQFVDVHLTVNQVPNRPDVSGLTLTLFRGVRILAMAGARTRSTVTLELSPMQATIAIQAQSRGKISMTYNPEGRGTGVVSVPDEDRATLAQILDLDPLPVPEPPFRSEHYRGSTRTSLEWHNGRRSSQSAAAARGGAEDHDIVPNERMGTPDGPSA